MAEYYRKEDVQKIVSDFLCVIETKFYDEAPDSPEGMSPYLKGYSFATHRLMRRLKMLDDKKPLKSVK